MMQLLPSYNAANVMDASSTFWIVPFVLVIINDKRATLFSSRLAILAMKSGGMSGAGIPSVQFVQSGFRDAMPCGGGSSTGGDTARRSRASVCGK